jgi:hypothetical protein
MRQDLDKLARWLVKIQTGDFFPDERRQQAAALMARCRSVLDGFSHAVYLAEGVQDVTDGEAWDIVPLDGAEPDSTA